MTSVTEPPSLCGCVEALIYDGLGNRVQKILDAGRTVYVYDAFDQPAAEYTTAVPAPSPCGTCYPSADHLGSTRLVTDQESGLDYFNARYLDGPLGRFTSPDPANAGADLYNPQSWNGYTYVANNPPNSFVKGVGTERLERLSLQE